MSDHLHGHSHFHDHAADGPGLLDQSGGHKHARHEHGHHEEGHHEQGSPEYVEGNALEPTDHDQSPHEHHAAVAKPMRRSHARGQTVPLGASHAVAVDPIFSLLRLSLPARLGAAAAVSGLIWLGVAWALA